MWKKGRYVTMSPTASRNVTLSPFQPQSTHWEGRRTGRNFLQGEKDPTSSIPRSGRPGAAEAGVCVSSLAAAVWTQVNAPGPKATLAELLTQRC